MNNDQIYGLYLEDYSKFRANYQRQLYAGTIDDLRAFAETMKGYQGAEETYESLLNAINELPNNPNVKYEMGNKRSLSFYVMEEEYGRSYSVAKRDWYYIIPAHHVHHMYSEKVHIDERLLKCGDKYYRFIRARLEEPLVLMDGFGYVALSEDYNGFPGVYDFKNGCSVMNLYIFQKAYALDEKDKAISEFGDMKNPDLNDISKDIWGYC